MKEITAMIRGTTDASKTLTISLRGPIYSIYLAIENHAIKHPNPTSISSKLARSSTLKNPSANMIPEAII